MKEKFATSKARLHCAICGASILAGERVAVDDEGYTRFPVVYCHCCTMAIKEEVYGKVVRLHTEVDHDLSDLLERLDSLEELRHF